MSEFIDLFLHLDVHLAELIQTYGFFSYAILFIIIFCETGLVITPFLPGDSLLFAAGALVSTGAFDFIPLFMVLIVAAILGDMVNYHIGKYLGPKAFESKYQRFFKKKYLMRTQAFFEKQGGKAIIMARFVPILRTFAPFLAGVGIMNYKKFFVYNLTGAVLWVGSMVMAGYFFGEIPIVKENFSLVVLGIIFVSLLPMVFEYLKAGREQEKAKKTTS